MKYRDLLGLSSAGAGAPRRQAQSDPAVELLLRETLSEAMRFSLLLSPSTAVLFAGILSWKGEVPFLPLALWCTVVLIQVLGHYPSFAKKRDRTSPTWSRRVMVGQAIGGINWGLLPVIAMPTPLQWRPFVGVLMLSIVAACTSFSAASRAAFWSFIIPLTAMTVPAFLINGGPTGMAYAAVFGYAVPFAAILHGISGLGHESAAALAVKNAGLVGSLSEEKELLGEANQLLAHRATHDPLTGLLNRAGCMAALNSALRDRRLSSTRTALLFIDLDNFKLVNDTFGHDSGDQLLCALSSRVSRALPGSAVVARLGGDELTLVLPDVSSPDEATAVARRIIKLFEQPFDISGRLLTASASIGIAIAEPQDTALDLLRFADAALYKAKDAGRNRYELFDASLRESLDDRVENELALRAAIGEGQIVAYVQPFVSLSTGDVVGGEALARWMHPAGIRNAGSFIELAERANLLGDISLAVLEQVHDVRVRSAILSECPISVNVPPTAISRVMRGVDAQSHHLEGLYLEITENGTIDDVDEARDLLDEARAAGAKILFDDLGVGEAPLALLTELPLDGIKIDCDFVWKIETSLAARSVIEAIVKVAEGMNLWVVAEGVETESQAALLYELGVPAAQGYLFAPAVSMSEFEVLVGLNRPFPAPWSRAVTGSQAPRGSL